MNRNFLPNFLGYLQNGHIFPYKPRENDNRVLKKGNASFIIFSTQMYSLEYKEAFYMHFRKFDPCGVKLERGGHIDPPPTYELTQKSPLLVGLN